MSENIDAIGMPDMDPLAAELEAYELLDAYDKRTLIQAAMRKTAFAAIGYVNELRESKTMAHAKENMAIWLGEQATDKRNIRIVLGVAGAALAIVAARKLLKEDWDEKLSEGLQSLTQAIKNEDTTVSIERDLGALGQPQAAQEVFDELGNQLTLVGDMPAPGAFPRGVAMIRNAFSRTVFAFKRRPIEQPPE